MRAARMPATHRSAIWTGKDVLQQVFGKHTRRKFLAGLRLKVRFRSGTCAATGGKISLQAEHRGVSLPRPSTRFVYSHDKLPALKYQRNGDELRRAAVDYWWGTSSGRCPILFILFWDHISTTDRIFSRPTAATSCGSAFHRSSRNNSSER